MKSKSPPKNETLLPNINDMKNKNNKSLFSNTKGGGSIQPSARSDDKG
jgi:hypothetical protein